jgi:alkane 1-monooxygenase
MRAQRSWRLHPGSIGFLLAYALPTGMIASAWFGAHTGYPDLFAWLPLFFSHGVVPVIDTLWPRPAPIVMDEAVSSWPWRAYYTAVPVLSLPAELAMLYAAGNFWSWAPLSGVGRVGLLLSTGIYSAMFAITISHELIHRRERWQRVLGGALLSTVGFGSFKIIHLQIHHRYVGTPLDFATARWGQTIYSFWRQCLVGNFYGAARCERQHLAKVGKAWWQSELLAWYGLTALWLAIAVMLWGAAGAVYFLAQGLIAILKLDCINYLQHYGLVRRTLPDGAIERVQAHHIWSNDCLIDDLILLNLPRHAEHHLHPQTPYHLLRPVQETPSYPYCYGLMSLLTLWPPLFRRVVHPRLAEFAGGLPGSPTTPVGWDARPI